MEKLSPSKSHKLPALNQFLYDSLSTRISAKNSEQIERIVEDLIARLSADGELVEISQVRVITLKAGNLARTRRYTPYVPVFFRVDRRLWHRLSLMVIYE